MIISSPVYPKPTREFHCWEEVSSHGAYHTSKKWFLHSSTTKNIPAEPNVTKGLDVEGCPLPTHNFSGQKHQKHFSLEILHPPDKWPQELQNLYISIKQKKQVFLSACRMPEEKKKQKNIQSNPLRPLTLQPGWREWVPNRVANTNHILRSVEVLNLPRVPWRIGMTTFSYFSDTVGLAAGEAVGESVFVVRLGRRRP